MARNTSTSTDTTTGTGTPSTTSPVPARRRPENRPGLEERCHAASDRYHAEHVSIGMFQVRVDRDETCLYPGCGGSGHLDQLAMQAGAPGGPGKAGNRAVIS